MNGFPVNVTCSGQYNQQFYSISSMNGFPVNVTCSGQYNQQFYSISSTNGFPVNGCLPRDVISNVWKGAHAVIRNCVRHIPGVYKRLRPNPGESFCSSSHQST